MTSEAKERYKGTVGAGKAEADALGCLRESTDLEWYIGCVVTLGNFSAERRKRVHKTVICESSVNSYETT